MRNEEFGAEEIYLAPERNSEEGMIKESLQTAINAKVRPMAAVRVSEVKELRGSNRKVYRMSNGSEQAVFYPEEVHVLNKDTGCFEDVDAMPVMEEDGRYFVNRRERFAARFSCEEDNDELFSIESGVHRVTVFAMRNAKQKKSSNVVAGRMKRMSDRREASSIIAFEDVRQGSDYEYSVTGNGVKENIIVKEPADVYRYSFVLRMENVTAQFDEVHKRIAFVSNETGREVFFIPVPFMTDASGETSTAVDYEFRCRTALSH